MSDKHLEQRRKKPESFRLEPIRTSSNLSTGMNNYDGSINSTNCKRRSISSNNSHEYGISGNASQFGMRDSETACKDKIASFRHRRTMSILEPLSASSTSTRSKREQIQHQEIKKNSVKRRGTDVHARMQPVPVYWQAREENALFAGPLGELIGYVDKGHIIREVTRYCDPFGGWWLCVVQYHDLQTETSNFTSRIDDQQRQRNSDFNGVVNNNTTNININEENRVAWVSFNNSQWHSCATQHIAEPLWSCVRWCADTSAVVEDQNCKPKLQNANNKTLSKSKQLNTDNFTTNCNTHTLGVWEETECPLHVAPLAELQDMYLWNDQENITLIQSTVASTIDNCGSGDNNNNDSNNNNNNNNNGNEQCGSACDTCSKSHSFVQKVTDADLIDYYWSHLSTQSCLWNSRFQSLLENVVYADDKVHDEIHNVCNKCENYAELELQHFIDEFVEVAEEKVVELVSELGLPRTERTFVPHSSLTNVFYIDDLMFIICAQMLNEGCTGNENSVEIATQTFYHYQQLSVHAPSHFCHVPLQCLVEFCGHTVRVMAIPPTNIHHFVYKQSRKKENDAHAGTSQQENSTLPHSPQLVKRLMEQITNSMFFHHWESKEGVTQSDAEKNWLTFDAECYAGWDHRLYLLDVNHCLPSLMTLPSINQRHDNIEICKVNSISNTIKRDVNSCNESHKSSNYVADKSNINFLNCTKTQSTYTSCLMRPELLQKLSPLPFKHTKELVTTSQLNRSVANAIEDKHTHSNLLKPMSEEQNCDERKKVKITENDKYISSNVDMCGEREWKLEVCDIIKHHVITTVAGTLGLHLHVTELDMPCVECTLCNQEISNEMRFVVCDSEARCCHICQHCYLHRLVAVNEMERDANVEERRLNKHDLIELQTSMDEHIANDGNRAVPLSIEMENKQSVQEEECCININGKSKILSAFEDAVKCNGNARHWNALLLEPNVATLFHSHGLNLRFLPLVYHRLPQPTKFAMGHYCKVEILARCAAHLLRRKLRVAATTLAEIQQCATVFFTTFLETYSERAAEFFANELAAEINDCYGTAVLPFATSKVSKLLLAEALQTHTGVRLTANSLNSLRESDFVNSQLLNLPKYDYTNTSSLSDQKEYDIFYGNPFIEVEGIYPIVKKPTCVYAKHIRTLDLSLSQSTPSPERTQSLQSNGQKPELNLQQHDNKEFNQRISNDHDVNEAVDNRIDFKTLSELLLF